MLWRKKYFFVFFIRNNECMQKTAVQKAQYKKYKRKSKNIVAKTSFVFHISSGRRRGKNQSRSVIYHLKEYFVSVLFTFLFSRCNAEEYQSRYVRKNTIGVPNANHIELIPEHMFIAKKLQRCRHSPLFRCSCQLHPVVSPQIMQQLSDLVFLL